MVSYFVSIVMYGSRIKRGYSVKIGVTNVVDIMSDGERRISFCFYYLIIFCIRNCVLFFYILCSWDFCKKVIVYL